MRSFLFEQLLFLHLSLVVLFNIIVLENTRCKQTKSTMKNTQSFVTK